MPEHRSVTTTIAGPRGTVTVHFHCPCGVDRQEIVVTGLDEVHPVSRYTAAIRNLHRRGNWPPAEPIATFDDETIAEESAA